MHKPGFIGKRRDNDNEEEDDDDLYCCTYMHIIIIGESWTFQVCKCTGATIFFWTDIVSRESLGGIICSLLMRKS